MSTVDSVIQRDTEAALNYDLGSICWDETRLFDDVMTMSTVVGHLYSASRHLVIRALA